MKNENKKWMKSKAKTKQTKKKKMVVAEKGKLQLLSCKPNNNKNNSECVQPTCCKRRSVEN